MAFTIATFAPIGGQATDAPTRWSYSTLDDIATVSAPGYFNTVGNDLEDGDEIYIVASDGTIYVSVSIVGGGIVIGGIGGGGSGDVTGPGASVVDGISVFASTTGKVLKDSGIRWQDVVQTDSTGLISGGGLSVASATQINIASGRGYVVDQSDPDNPVVTQVMFGPLGPITITDLGSQNATVIGIDSAGLVQQQALGADPSRNRSQITLGIVHHIGGTVNGTDDASQTSSEVYSQLIDVLESLGPTLRSGLTVTPQASLRVDLAAGAIMAPGVGNASGNVAPNVRNIPANLTATFDRLLSSTQTISAVAQTTLDPVNYDNGSGTPVAVGGGATIQYLFQLSSFDGATTGLFAAYGQTVYADLSTAVANATTDNFQLIPAFSDIALLVARIAVLDTATDLSNSAEAVLLPGAKFGTGISGGSATGGAGGGDVSGPAGAGNDNIALFDGPTGKLIKDSGQAIASINGDVVGPAGAVDSNLAAFDTATGKLLKDSGVDPTTLGDMTGPAGAVDSNLVAFDTASGKLVKDSGVDPTSLGDVFGPAGATAGNVPLFNDASGKLLADSGLDATDLGDVQGPGLSASPNIAVFADASGTQLNDSGVDVTTRGDVFGPAGAVDNEVAAFDTATGKLVKGSGVDAGSLGDVTGSGLSATDRLAVYTDGTGKEIKDSGLDLASVGDMTGPAGATDNTLAAFDATTGKLVKDTGIDADLVTLQDSTGLVSGGAITISGATTINIAAGVGYVVDHATPGTPIITAVNFGPFTNVSITNIGSQNTTTILIDESAAIVQANFTVDPALNRSAIRLGRVVHESGSVDSVSNASLTPRQVYPQLVDIMDSLGVTLRSGLALSFNADLTFTKTAGAIMSPGAGNGSGDPGENVANISGEAPVTFSRLLGVTDNLPATAQTDIDPVNYDTGAGTPTAVGGAASSTTIQYVFQAPGLTTGVFVMYGQTIYTDLDDALANAATDDVTLPVEIRDVTLLLGRVAVRRDATDLSDTAQARLLPGSKFGTALSGGASSGASGGGDVLGPAGATDDNIVAFDGGTGKTVKDSGVAVTDLVIPVSATQAGAPTQQDNLFWYDTDDAVMRFGTQNTFVEI